MASPSVEELIQRLRASGLFTSEQFSAVLRELAPIGSDSAAAVRHLLDTGRLSAFQLRKVLAGKAADLFFGPYVISGKLGEGGMGQVYRATQLRVGREVALKVIRPNLLANPVVRGRYNREAMAAETLAHPNIVRLIDADEIDGRFYLALEFVDGPDLARLVKDHGVLSVSESCEYIRQAALGLQHAHDQGFVHRDIKPSNVVVSGERHVPGARGPARVKVLDMGLVCGGFAEDAGGTDLTRAGTVVGTPDFMAPEQARNSSTVDRRADLYALGCTFYFLLTGRPPFPDGTAMDKLFQHQIEPPPPLQSLRPDVPEELARIVARLMAKKPEERFDSAGELALILIPLTRQGGAPLAHPGWVAGADANLAETWPPAAMHTLTIAVTAASSPFDFPPEKPSLSSGSRTARMPILAANRSGAALVIGAIIAVLLVLATLTWAALRHDGSNRFRGTRGSRACVSVVQHGVTMLQRGTSDPSASRRRAICGVCPGARACGIA